MTPRGTYDVNFEKQLLAVYNHTSLAVKAEAPEFFNDEFPSMAGHYRKILLLNVINEFPAQLIECPDTRRRYEEAIAQEREEAWIFEACIADSGVPQLFAQNRNATFELRCVPAKEFAEAIEMPQAKRDYLKRYFV